MAQTRSRKHNTHAFGYIKNGYEAKEWIKCRQNPIYFMKTYVKIDHPIQGLIPFSLFLFQEFLVQIFTQKKHTIVLKPRQMGITTVVAAYILWLITFYSYKQVVLLSIKYSTSIYILKRIKIMYMNLPDFLREPSLNSHLENLGRGSELEFLNHSSVRVVASTEDAARSSSLSMLVMDEAAFIRQASGIWASARPTLSTGGSSIVMSTAFGMGNFFHQEWTQAVQGKNMSYPVKLNWRMHPDYNDTWYAEQLAAMGSKRMAQEIDCDFLQSGMTVFDMAKIRAIEERLNQLRPISTEAAGIDGKILYYHEYDPERMYTIGSDVSTGRARDFSAFSVMDERGKEYACYKGKIQPRELGHVLMKVGYKYGRACLAPEINSIGEGTLAVLQEHGYENIYNDVANVLRLDEWEHRESDVMGWVTTGKTRNEIITGLDEDLEHDLVELYNPYIVQEAYTFIYDERNKPIALGKNSASGSSSAKYYEDVSKVYTDDAIIGGGITNQVRKNPRRFQKGLPPIFMGGLA